MNFARLNHILIPATKEGRDAQRDRWLVRVLFGPMARVYLALTDLGRGLLGLAFLAGLMGLDVLRGQNYYVAAALWALIIGSLAVRRLFTARGLALEIHAPSRAMAGEPIPFRVVLRNEGDAPLHALRLRRPFLPWDGQWTPGEHAVAELAAGAHAELVSTGTFVARGRHHIDTFGVAATLPLGLATGPELESRGTRFIVWPRPIHLGDVSFDVAASESARQTPRARAGGESLELLGLRPYRPGDSVRDLHAATWARLGEPVVREYQAEERACVAIVLDADLSNETRFEAAVSVAAGLIIDAASADAEIVLVVLDADHPTPIALGRGRGAVDAGFDALANVRAWRGDGSGESEPESDAALSSDDVDLARLALSLAGDAQIFFVTPSDDGSGFERAAVFARGAAPIRLFVLEPKPTRFARGDRAPVGAPVDAGFTEVRRVPSSVWSGRLRPARRRRP